MNRSVTLASALVLTCLTVPAAAESVTGEHIDVGYFSTIAIFYELPPGPDVGPIDEDGYAAGNEPIDLDPATTTFKREAYAQVSDGFDGDCQTDVHTIGVGSATASVEASWTPDFTSGTIELVAAHDVALDASYIDIDADCTTYPPAETTPIAAGYDATADVLINVQLAVDAPATLTFAWSNVSGATGFLFIDPQTGFQELLDLSGAGRTYTLSPGSYTFGLFVRHDTDASDPSGDLVSVVQDGAIVTWQVVFPEPEATPCEALEALGEEVVGADLHRGITVALASKLHAAQGHLCDDDASDDDEAAGPLHAFRNQVLAQRGKKIPVDVADALLDAVDALLDAL